LIWHYEDAGKLLRSIRSQLKPWQKKSMT
jgi:hypothetical protein